MTDLKGTLCKPRFCSWQLKIGSGKIIMRPSLYLFKKENGRSEYSMKTEVQVVVVDLDKSKKYPQNFLCILPQTAISRGNTSNIFNKVFGQNSLDVAKKLLHRALKSEQDDEIRKELQTRLKTLKTYPVQNNIFVAREI